MTILHRLKAISRDQQGFTLAEIVIAIAITALIGSAVATATYQVVNINSSSTNHQIAITQVQNAVHSISRDAQQAQYTIPKDSAGDPLPLDTVPIGSTKISFDLIAPDKIVIEWIEWDMTDKEITYSVVNGSLQRTLSIYVNDVLTEQTSTYVANNISAFSGNWDTDLNSKVLTVTITATVNVPKPSIETRTFQIKPRPAQ
jgi:prepilin-type N-terminal cleavage/methylation domain-containing protein